MYQKLVIGLDVVVSNTFTTNKEMRKYLELVEDFPNLEIKIIEMKNDYGSIHNVPEEALNKMRLRWEELPTHQQHLVEKADAV